DPFTSILDPTVHFLDSIDANLQVYDALDESNGQGLGVNPDAESALIIRFDVPTRRLRILFSNDDDCCSQACDRATLTVRRNGKVGARRNVTLNVNNKADQTIEYAGRTAIDEARFVYNRAGTPIDLIE